MTYKRSEELITSLIESTNNKKIQWETTVSESIFQCSFSAGVVSLNHYFDHDREEDNSYFTLKNSDGRVVVSLSDAEIPAISKLYDLARSSALNADEVIDGILGFLEKDD